ncbi:T9SS type A sorting domain-containing protein (plasmid) [Adhaeribacter swui]|uniref:T9SS type A sorting domain-containing protein n=1 Tax=Adhaeribacter swui TaxID=2086471 RepID=A0A7G7G2E6_9BACT|nr:T9SS type A sorting domain-containing protein [Adhaeribacter swui]QNF31330.1 T9SS type A sorting domain-containing protein [Adhaeribacter swui]
MKTRFTRIILLGLLVIFSFKAFPFFLSSSNNPGRRTWQLEANAPPTAILFSGSITENINFAGIVGKFTTIDADAEEEHIYYLVPGEGDADNDKFLIIGNELEIHTWPNYEIQNIYHIRVRTDDQRGGVLEKAFAIPVKEINEAPLGIVLSPSAIEENNLPGAVVGLLSVMDEDTLDQHTYRLVAGAGDEDNAAFTLAGNELRAAISFDYETKSSYHIRLQVRDKENLTYESKFVITIKDQVEVEPKKQEEVTLPQEEPVQAGFRASPNPVKEYLHLSFETAMDEVHLINSVGQRVFVQRTNSKQLDLDTRALSSGVYTALIYAKGKVYAKRIQVVK